MSPPPAQPKIYHITHVGNLPSIIGDGLLLSDASVIARGGPPAAIGNPGIKQRRLRLPVDCHPGDVVGDYVPFYFCPRSVMLFVIHRANHPELAYRDGQGPIVHLEADLHEVVAWAEGINRRWAFSLSNAGAVYARFRSSLNDLDQVDWAAVAATDFRSAAVKEAKQAEFLVHGAFPWNLVRRIGVRSYIIRDQVDLALRAAAHKPPVSLQPGWYF